MILVILKTYNGLVVSSLFTIAEMNYDYTNKNSIPATKSSKTIAYKGIYSYMIKTGLSNDFDIVSDEKPILNISIKNHFFGVCNIYLVRNTSIRTSKDIIGAVLIE